MIKKGLKEEIISPYIDEDGMEDWELQVYPFPEGHSVPSKGMIACHLIHRCGLHHLWQPPEAVVK